MPWKSLAHLEQAKLLIKDAGAQDLLVKNAWISAEGVGVRASLCPLATISQVSLETIACLADPSGRIKAAVEHNFGPTIEECTIFVDKFDSVPADAPLAERAIELFDAIPVGK